MKIIDLNKKEINIFLDLDGVICNWLSAAAKTFNIDDSDPKIRDFLKSGKDIDELVKGDIWQLIDKEGEDWWTNLEIFPWTHKLVNSLRKESSNFAFLTSPSNNPICCSGKTKWIKKHFGEQFKDFIITSKKYLCASKNSILIDDLDKNISKFKKYGGYTYLWPHSYRFLDKEIDVNDTIKDLIKYIKILKKVG